MKVGVCCDGVSSRCGVTLVECDGGCECGCVPEGPQISSLEDNCNVFRGMDISACFESINNPTDSPSSIAGYFGQVVPMTKWLN